MFHAALDFLWIAASATILLTLAAVGLTRLGRGPKWLGDVFTRAPVLDIVVACLSWVPWVGGAIRAGWLGVAAALAGQVAAYFIWITLHERSHPDAVRGPRIVKFINGAVGRWQNHAALWVTLVALPCFWHFRILQILLYPLLVWTLRFPRYRSGDWINVSRHKFQGLVGHDLFWCLYCDWMTGVTSLGVEMLRNVESFWCPIRFYDGKKCENCKIDFPDIEGGWVPASGDMKQVERTLETMYGAGQRAWFGHPVRLTVKGKEKG